MVTRRGMGKGLGCGYKNLVPLDRHVHSMSAKGVKSQIYLKKTGEKFNIINSLSNPKKDKYAIEDMNGMIFTDVSSKEFKKTSFDATSKQRLTRNNFLSAPILSMVQKFPIRNVWYLKQMGYTKEDKGQIFLMFDNQGVEHEISLRRTFPRQKQGAGGNTKADLEWVVNYTENHYNNSYMPYLHTKNKKRALNYLRTISSMISRKKDKSEKLEWEYES